jgi:sugar lactone lactonase YvrE
MYYFMILTDGIQVSFVIPLEGTKDKFVIAVGRNVALLTWDGESSTPTDVKYVTAVDNEKEIQDNTLNDGKADPTGRLWAGMIQSQNWCFFQEESICKSDWGSAQSFTHVSCIIFLTCT